MVPPFHSQRLFVIFFFLFVRSFLFVCLCLFVYLFLFLFFQTFLNVATSLLLCCYTKESTFFNRVPTWWRHKNFLCILAFWIACKCIWEAWWKNIHRTNGGNRFIGARDMAVWMHNKSIELARFQRVMKQTNLHCFQWGWLGIHAVIDSYLRPPWTDSFKILCVRVFYHVLLKFGHELLKCINKLFMTSHFCTLVCPLSN